MNPFKRIKIGDHILALEHIVRITLSVDNVVCITMAFDEDPWSFTGEEADLLRNHLLPHGQFIEAAEGIFLNIDIISSASLIDDKVRVWAADHDMEPSQFCGDRAKNSGGNILSVPTASI